MKLKYNELNTRQFEAHSIVLSLIKAKTKILDLGCATGYMGEELMRSKNCEVWGLELDQKLATKAKRVLKKVTIGNLEDIDLLKIDNNSFDYVLLIDVIEHITFYKETLKKIKKYLKKDGKLIISTPNIAHVSIRCNLLMGKFTYEEKGILDRTHVHFFTKASLQQALIDSDYKINAVEYSADFGQIPVVGRVLKYVPKLIQHFFTNAFGTLLGVQLIVVCSK